MTNSISILISIHNLFHGENPTFTKLSMEVSVVKQLIIQTSNRYRCKITYHPLFFPTRTEVVQFGKKKNVGPWTIQTEIVSSSEENSLLKIKAIEAIEDLMSGNIQYYVKVLETDTNHIQPLTLIEKFTKDTRPISWKNVDLKVESTLPILGNDVGTTKILADSSKSSKTRLARVTLSMNTTVEKDLV